MVRVAVAGGTGTVGRYVVTAAAAAGHDVVAISRSSGVDLVTGRGLQDALTGVDAVIDVGGITTASRRRSVAYFETATQSLLTVGARAGVQHHVALSIVGSDRVDFGYYYGKRVQEDLVLTGPIPSSVLRASQFHEFAGQVLALRGGPVAFLPRMRTQPVAAVEVAAALVDLLSRPPAGLVPDFAGPEVHDLHDLARQLLAARGERRAVVPVRLPGSTGRALAAGGLLPTSAGRRGQQSFGTWLEAHGPRAPMP